MRVTLPARAAHRRRVSTPVWVHEHDSTEGRREEKGRQEGKTAQDALMQGGARVSQSGSPVSRPLRTVQILAAIECRARAPVQTGGSIREPLWFFAKQGGGRVAVPRAPTHFPLSWHSPAPTLWGQTAGGNTFYSARKGG